MENIVWADIRSTLIVIGVFVAFLASLLTFVKMVRSEKERAEQPYIRVKNAVDDHEKRIAKLEASSDVNSVENKLMMRMQLALVRHAIDGNNVEGLRDMREEVQNYLVNK